ncbi:MAG: DUF4476 domain-containing protein [Bacteroidetes bacterium]|nr:DUF4476 domain-containing protein [Bacteroidota bacterium]
MKTKFFITVFALLLLAGAASAQSTLSIIFYGDKSYSVDIDGKDYGFAQDEFRADLNGGKHYIKIYDALRAGMNPVYEGSIDIPDGSSVYATLNENYKFEIIKKSRRSDNHQYCNCNCEYCRNCIYKDKGGRRHNEYNENNNTAMSDRDFNSLTESVRMLIYDDNKREMINTALDKNYVTSDQVKSLLGLFTFEASKLDIAKNAYNRTVDKENYFRVMTAFTFESTIMELKDYINKQK